MKWERAGYLITAVFAVFLGLASRRYSQFLPEFVADYAGDTLWALVAYLGARTLFPKWKVGNSVIAALIFSFSIEISQLYHSPWIDQIRHTTAGGLILGYGFMWTDLLCYLAGVGTGAILDTVLHRTPKLKRRN